MRFWDSSALVPLLVNEDESGIRAGQLLEDATLAVWWGTSVECESALQRRVRDGSLKPAGLRQAHLRLQALNAAWHEVPPTVSVRTLAVRILRTHPLRAADSLQLAAALTLSQALPQPLTFLSSDLRLVTAAEIEGLVVV